jgi:hypothetical protein
MICRKQQKTHKVIESLDDSVGLTSAKEELNTSANQFLPSQQGSSSKDPSSHLPVKHFLPEQDDQESNESFILPEGNIYNSSLVSLSLIARFLVIILSICL